MIYKYFSLGICSGCEDCQNAHEMDEPSLRRAIETCELEDEPFFSTNSCDLCNSSLAGDRYVAHYRDDDDNIVHAEVCIDCVERELF